MKRAMLALLAVACLASFAVAAVTVTSENVAGVVKVQIPAGEIRIVGINIDAINPADANLKALLADQLKAGANPGDGDQVKFWDTAASKYKTYQVKLGTGEFYGTDDYVNDWILGSATNPVVVAGNAFWIIATATTNVDISLTGQAVEADPATVKIVEGPQFLSHPLSSMVNIQDLDMVNDGAVSGANPGDGDTIKFWDGTKYVSAGLKNTVPVKWYDSDDYVNGWILGSPLDIDIDLGVGFWYISENATPGGYDWTQANPYAANL